MHSGRSDLATDLVMGGKGEGRDQQNMHSCGTGQDSDLIWWW
jgi:hypothetical protein